MKICEKCSNHLDDSLKFCIKCGQEVTPNTKYFTEQKKEIKATRDIKKDFKEYKEDNDNKIIIKSNVSTAYWLLMILGLLINFIALFGFGNVSFIYTFGFIAGSFVVSRLVTYLYFKVVKEKSKRRQNITQAIIFIIISVIACIRTLNFNLSSNIISDQTSARTLDPVSNVIINQNPASTPTPEPPLAPTPEPPLAPVSGCTNSLATNYNPSATVDNGSCTIPRVDPVKEYINNHYTPALLSAAEGIKFRNTGLNYVKLGQGSNAITSFNSAINSYNLALNYLGNNPPSSDWQRPHNCLNLALSNWSSGSSTVISAIIAADNNTIQAMNLTQQAENYENIGDSYYKCAVAERPR